MGYSDAYVAGYSDTSVARGGIDPIVAVEWSPTTDPLETPVWEGIAGWRAVQTDRGRQNELDQIQAGTASIVLDNRDRRFDPLYTAGPNYGNVLPMKRFRIRGSQGGTTHDIFQGFVDSWDQSYVNPNDATVEVRLTDFFAVLNAAIFSPSPYEVEVRADNPKIWFRLGDPAGTTTVVDTIRGARGSLLSGTLGTDGLVTEDTDTALSTAPLAGQGVHVSDAGARLPAGSAYTIEMLVMFRAVVAATRHTVFSLNTVTDNTPLVEIYISEADGKLYANNNGSVSTGVTVATGTVYHLALVNEVGGQFYVNGTGYATGGGFVANMSGPYRIGGRIGELLGASPDGVIDDFAIYESALSGPRIAAHAEAALTPWIGDTTGERVDRVLDYLNVAAADRSVDTTTTTLQQAALGQSLLSHLQDVNEVEQGLLFVTKDGKVRSRSRHNGFNLTSQGTFGDGAGELRYNNIAFEYSKQLIYNVVRRQIQGGQIMEASDATSIERYGRRVDSRSGLLAESDLVARDLASYRLAKTKDAVQRVTSVDLLPERDPTTLYPQVLGREIGEQVTILRRPQGVGSAINFDARIEGISHTITPNTWETTFRLSPADTGQYLRLDLTSGPGLGSLQLAY